jgi:hypothetical protein
MPKPTQNVEAPSCWRSDYWLRHCEEYRVFAGGDPIGYVEDIVFGADEEPTALVIRVGEAFTHLLTVGVDGIEGFDPGGERLFIGSLADLGPEAFARQLRIPAAV